MHSCALAHRHAVDNVCFLCLVPPPPPLSPTPFTIQFFSCLNLRCPNPFTLSPRPLYPLASIVPRRGAPSWSSLFWDWIHGALVASSSCSASCSSTLRLRSRFREAGESSREITSSGLEPSQGFPPCVLNRHFSRSSRAFPVLCSLSGAVASAACWHLSTRYSASSPRPGFSTSLHTFLHSHWRAQLPHRPGKPSVGACAELC